MMVRRALTLTHAAIRTSLMPIQSDADFMRAALRIARQAGERGEVPVGAVLVLGGAIVAEGCNLTISTSDPTAHAEIVALRAAAQRLGNYRLAQSALYTTLEPCPMCAGAIMHARVARVLFAAHDPKGGASGSVVDLFAERRLNHHTEVIGGVLADDSALLLREFFGARRLKTKNEGND
jgi:tRNA(adenine34) deaminase